MQTENIRASLRPRAGWEAVDLGFRMARVWWRALFGAWLAVVVPTAILLNFLFQDSLGLAAFALWLLKPAFDRVALFVLSEALFGRIPSVTESLRALPGLLRTGLVGSLSIYRLSPMRSLVLPVLQLEGLRGRARRDRVRLLVGRESNVGFGLIVACLHFELLVVGLGCLSLIWIFLPAGVDLGPLELASAWLFAEGGWPVVAGNAVLVLAMSAIEPFYVAAGFSVYLNRRVYLEGWDIDLEFRKLARRAAPRAGAAAVGGGIALALLLVPTAQASDCTQQPQSAKACIEAIMATPEFETVRRVELWVPKNAPDAGDRATEPSGLSELAELLALLFQIMLWGAVALALFALLRRLSQRARDEASAEVREGPEITLRPAPRSEPLPLDPIGEARSRFAEGDAIAALSLLYRGVLAYLSESLGLRLPASATEDECTRAVSERLEAGLARDFAELARSWQRCAYAGRRPEPAAFHLLCERWASHFGATG